MHKKHKGKNITVSTNHTQVTQKGTLHVSDVVKRLYDTETCLPVFHSPQNIEYCQISFTVQ